MTAALREPTVFILSTLARGPLHGYGVIKAVEELSGGRLRLRAGTLYDALDRLARDGFVVFEGEESVGGPPRRNFAITAAGRRLLAAEAARMEETASVVRAQLARRMT
ncbi:MAG: PadR family transcriptional regulator [Acidimicrobiales bacterium]